MMSLDSANERKVTLILKRVAFSLAVTLATMLIVFIAWFGWSEHTFVDHAIQSDSGLAKYTFLSQDYTRDHWSAELVVPVADGERLLKKYSFQNGYTPAILAGKLPPANASQCTGCLYYLEVGSRGPYGYELFRITPDKQHVNIYVVFAD